MATRTEETINKWKQKVPKGRCLNDGSTHFRKGRTPWNKGIPMSEDAKEKLSKKMRKNPTNYWKGKSRPDMCGENNPLWNGGNSRAYKNGYYSVEYKRWRKNVFERDKYTCQECEQVGGYLTAHHIKSFAKYPTLRFELSNGRTLCEECHKMTDNYAGKGKGGHHRNL